MDKLWRTLNYRIGSRLRVVYLVVLAAAATLMVRDIEYNLAYLTLKLTGFAMFSDAILGARLTEQFRKRRTRRK